MKGTKLMLMGLFFVYLGSGEFKTLNIFDTVIVGLGIFMVFFGFGGSK